MISNHARPSLRLYHPPTADFQQMHLPNYNNNYLGYPTIKGRSPEIFVEITLYRAIKGQRPDISPRSTSSVTTSKPRSAKSPSPS